MKTLTIASFASLATLLVGCSTYQTQPLLAFTGGDGTSCQQAVVISGASYHETGFVAERVWLGQRYPGSHETAKSTMVSGNRHYDLYELKTSDGQSKKVYFDSTDFFAK
jgi:hypothetical protein